MSSTGGSARSSTRRLLKELDGWRAEQQDEKGIERLGPVNEEDLFVWEAVVNGRDIGSGYDGTKKNPPVPLRTAIIPYPYSSHFRPSSHAANLLSPTAGRWLLSITIPPSYPLQPPKMRFATPIVHPNIALRDGEICLDLLKDAWTPAYSVLECVRAVRMLLSCPETDSPLNVDVAALIRGGDVIGARRLVEFWCADVDGRYDGP
jgi:peroxin-4